MPVRITSVRFSSCALAHVQTTASRFGAVLLVAVLLTTSSLGVGLHLCAVDNHLDQARQSVCSHAVCGHGAAGHDHADGLDGISRTDDACPICRFLSKWQSPPDPEVTIPSVSLVAIVSDFSTWAPFAPILPGYSARAPPRFL